MNKKQYEIYKAYVESELITLYDCYERFSENKHQAYLKCREKCLAQEGMNFSIISYNSVMFTCGWQFKKNNELWFHYETHKTTKEWLVK